MWKIHICNTLERFVPFFFNPLEGSTSSFYKAKNLVKVGCVFDA